MQPCPNIVFDLDGTLVDSAPSLCKAGNALLKTLGRPAIDVETYKRFIGKGMLKQVEQLLHYTGGIPEDSLEEHFIFFQEEYERIPLAATMIYDGVSDVLQTLKLMPSRLAICTQKLEKPAQRVLCDLSLQQYFEGFTFGDTLTVMKPNADTVFHSIKNFDYGPLIYVGDSETDSMTAKNANAIFLMFVGGYRNSPLVEIDHYAAFENHSEIPSLIYKILSEL